MGLNAHISPERISNYVLFYFHESLIHHFKEEEELIFTKLSVDNPLRKQAEAEHAFIYSLVDRIQEDKKNTSLLDHFAETLKNHIRFEERILFNQLQQVLTPAQIVEIISQTSDRPEDCDLKWKDKFW